MRVLITGHDGYIGTVLTPLVRDASHDVVGLDAYLFEGCSLGEAHVEGDPIDVRDVEIDHLRGFDAVIHLAAISNDPVGNLSPSRTYEINHRATVRLGWLAKRAGVKRFVFASSCSLYGAASPDELLTESAPFNPVTAYGEAKVLAERALSDLADENFSPVFLRNATVYGYSPRLRLDLAVNILTNLAVNTGRITVFGGAQKRPNIHIEDVTDLYVQSLEWPADRIDGQIFNAGYENHTVSQLADMVAGVVGRERVEIVTTPTDDHRSYHISSERIKRMLGFEPAHHVEEAVRDLSGAYGKGWIPDAMTDKRYYNIKTMREAKL